MAQFTIAARDPSTPAEQVGSAVRTAFQSMPSVTIVRADEDIGVVVVEAPEDQRGAMQDALGPEFMVDPNAPLNLSHNDS